MVCVNVNIIIIPIKSYYTHCNMLTVQVFTFYFRKYSYAQRTKLSQSSKNDSFVIVLQLKLSSYGFDYKGQ